MSSTTTEATSSLRHNSQLAVRLASGRQQHHDPQGAQHDSSSSQQQQQQQQPPAEVRRRPQRPAIPRHPIPSMQEAFAESLAEVTSGSVALKPKLRVDTPQVRRDRLLDQDKSEPPPESLWRMRPAQKYHELRKLLAQTAFGVYLLLKGMANSDAQVVAILQGHIDEIDDFLKTAMEDLKLATQDLNTRLDYLKLPLGNLAAFEEMLEDREFRLRIVEGNVRIEHILSRTTTALNQTIDDVAEGIRSTKEFTAYLTSEENGTWRTTRPAQVAEIFEAMRGNADGWLNAFAGLEEKTNTLDLLISKLADMVTDMDRCAGEVSRRTRFTIQPFTLPELTGPTSEESQDSYDTTPPQSPTTELSPVPPRLSIRFSGLSDILAPTVFLNDNDGSRSPDDSQLSLALQYTPPAEPETSEQLLSDKIYAFPRPSHHTSESTQERSTAARTSSPASNGKGAESSSVRSSATVREANSADKSTSKGKLGAGMANGGSSDSESADFVDAVESAASPTGARQEEEQETGELLFMLSPRTYSPQPSTSPLPSPRGSDTSKSTSSKEGRRSPHTQGGSASPQLGVPSRQNSLSPTSPQSGMSRSGSFSASRQASTAGSKPRGELQKQASIRERVAQRTTPPDAIHIPAINAPQHQRVDHAPPRTYEDQYGVASPESAHSSGSDRMVSIGIDEYTHETASAGYQNTPVGYDNSVPTYETIPEDYEDSPTSQGGYPIAYQASPADYRSSSAVRHYNPAVHEEISAPVRETGPMIREISPTGQETIPTTYYPNQPMANGSRNYSQPSIVPDLIPSPYSEQQFFRPVQASPFSPLQQRPHTAASQFPSRPYHSRGAPSTMGMSMVSGVTTMTKDSKGQTVKKKRSAFGWLKKAFTLDEEERMVYEQRRQAERQNVYYDARSPKFLDGKRIR